MIHEYDTQLAPDSLNITNSSDHRRFEILNILLEQQLAITLMTQMVRTLLHASKTYSKPSCGHWNTWSQINFELDTIQIPNTFSWMWCIKLYAFLTWKIHASTLLKVKISEAFEFFLKLLFLRSLFNESNLSLNPQCFDRLDIDCSEQ